MTRRSAITVGAPGIYEWPDAPLRQLTGVRMDVCAFAGVAPRGPARVPVPDERSREDQPWVEPDRERRRTIAVPVNSFEEYRALYGGFEGPGLLPYAVAAFFEQGGRRAYIARIVHRCKDPADSARGVAYGEIGGVKMPPAGKMGLWARDEGSWGNRLRAGFRYSTRPVTFESASTVDFLVRDGEAVAAGALLRLRFAGGGAELRYAAGVDRDTLPSSTAAIFRVTLDKATGGVPDTVEVVEGTLVVEDGERIEVHDRLGFALGHPRWIATVLFHESRLVYPDAGWAYTRIEPESAELAAFEAPAKGQFEGGEDLWSAIEPADFFDAAWVQGNDQPGDGVHAFALLGDVALVAAPDLYSPAEVAKVETVVAPVSLAGPEFGTCVAVATTPEQGSAAPGLDGLRRDPALPSELADIVEAQQALVALAEERRSFVVLLDVPPGLTHRQILEWRTAFRSCWAAAYHPWLLAARDDDGRDAIVRVPPSAAAAGIIARQELAHGVQHGPANALVAGFVNVDEMVSRTRHNQLHPAGINVFLRERDGIRLTGARTLSTESEWRQLSVRRLMTMLRRALEEQAQWLVFEPHDGFLRHDLRDFLTGYLRHLFAAGALRGADEEEAFYVRCDETVNPPASVDAGRLIAEVGVAPAEPAEFLVLRLTSDSDGRVTVEE